MVILSIIKGLVIIIFLLLAVAYFTLVERKILGAFQRRRGPNVIGLYGVLQPLSDGLKLFLKESIIPSIANKNVFFAAPIITFSVSLVGWGVVPYAEHSVLFNHELGLLFLFAVSSLGVFGVLLSGWASNSKYSFLGALRSAAQMVSYEIIIATVLLNFALLLGSLCCFKVVEYQQNLWNIVGMFPVFLLFFTGSLAETNRHPFDLPEAESELVSGYNVEYSSMNFALFFLGEYSNMLLMSAQNAILFLGGWLAPFYIVSGFWWFGLKILVFVFLFVIMRAILPRYRYDQLMLLGWKVLMPSGFFFLVFNSCVMITFSCTPY